VGVLVWEVWEVWEGEGGRGGTSIVVIFVIFDGVVEGSWLVGWLVGCI